MSISPASRQPLLDKCIVSTRPVGITEPDAAFEKSLAAWGAVVYAVPLIEIRARPFTLADAAGYDWLFFTSKNAVAAFWQEVSAEQAKQLDAARIAVVGPATGKQLLKARKDPSFIPPIYEGEAAARAFLKMYGDDQERVDGMRILWPCGNLASRGLADQLVAAGAVVDAPVVYETVQKRQLPAEAKALLAAGPDMLIFTSPSAVEAFQQMGLAGGGAKIAVLGPVTERAAQETFGRVDIKAPVYTLDALANAIYAYYASRASHASENPTEEG